MTPAGYTVRRATWAQDEAALVFVRRSVFIDEQHVPEREEWDSEDADSQHVLVEDNDGNPIGTGRLMRNGQIGRVAVLPVWRGKLVGVAIMQELMSMARQQNPEGCFLHAQTSVVDFYTRLGFTAYGEVFMDANIPHRAMRLRFK